MTVEIIGDKYKITNGELRKLIKETVVKRMSAKQISEVIEKNHKVKVTSYKVATQLSFLTDIIQQEKERGQSFYSPLPLINIRSRKLPVIKERE